MKIKIKGSFGFVVIYIYIYIRCDLKIMRLISRKNESARLGA